MKIRTITTGFNLRLPLTEQRLRRAAEPTLRLRDYFTKRGFEVQTVRLATQPWERWGASRDAMDNLVEEIQDLTDGLGIDYFSLGTTRIPEHAAWIEKWLRRTRTAFFTVTAGNRKGVNHRAASAAAGLIRSLAPLEAEGFANLRFAVLFNTPAGTPFFPAAYHTGPMGFALGLENSDLVMTSFDRARDIERAGIELRRVLTAACRRLERVAGDASREIGIRYAGLDVSIAPSVAPGESLALAFERLGLGRFGGAGSLAVAKIITDTLGRLPVRRCGYGGLMLPLLEDVGLAERNREGAFNLNNLLAFSAVCGTGLDTIPLPGDASREKIYALLLDLAALASKLDKPLSARLMPIPGKRAGEMTAFDFDYFVNSRIMSL